MRPVRCYSCGRVLTDELQAAYAEGTNEQISDCCKKIFEVEN